MSHRKITHPSRFVANKPVTIEEVDRDAHQRTSLVHQEFTKGFSFIKKYKKSASIFGSSMITAADPYYQKAERLGAKIAKAGYTIVTGGGPGIMEAANKGAFAAGGQSIGLNIKLPREQQANKYLTDYLEFYYFFSRKVMLAFAAEAYVFFPGGYGTLDEFFEIVTLVQTHRIVSIPIILVGSDFWKPMNQLIKGMLLAHHTISAEDLKIYRIEDDEERIVKIITDAPIMEHIPFNFITKLDLF